MMNMTFYVYKGWDRENPLVIIGSNVSEHRFTQEIKRLSKQHGELTVRNSLGGIFAVVTKGGKIENA